MKFTKFCSVVFVFVFCITNAFSQGKEITPINKNATLNQTVDWLKAGLHKAGKYVFISQRSNQIVFDLKPIAFEGCSLEYRFNKLLLETERRQIDYNWAASTLSNGANANGTFVSAESNRIRSNNNVSQPVESINILPDLRNQGFDKQPKYIKPFVKNTILGQIKLDVKKIDITQLKIKQEPTTNLFVLVLPLTEENLVKGKGITSLQKFNLGEIYFENEEIANSIKEGFVQMINFCR